MLISSIATEIDAPRTPCERSASRRIQPLGRAGFGEGLEEDHLPVVLPVVDQMKLTQDDNVLDVGCGTGWLVRLIAERVAEGRAIGMDISDEMVRHARRNYVAVENAMFVIGGVDEIPWDANFFTHAISVESAWPDPARGLREIHRVLREGGKAWILINYYLENVHSRISLKSLPLRRTC